MSDLMMRIGATVFRTADYWQQGFPTSGEDSDLLLKHGLIREKTATEQDEDLPDEVAVGDRYFVWTEEGIRVRDIVTADPNA